MARYFIEVAYKGTAYSGFQVQENAPTVQAEVEQAFQTLHRKPVQLTGSSRTDAGVHAYQNFFHFDYEDLIHPQAVYKLNAMLPGDVVVKNIIAMHGDAHSRFDAVSREYMYRLHQFKDPFGKQLSVYYPYRLNVEALKEGAAFVLTQENFFAFCKTNTQVKNYNCKILRSEFQLAGDSIIYRIEGNRFLRGMVRLLTATLLKLGRGQLSHKEFESYFLEPVKCGYSVPPHGLFLFAVRYPEKYFPATPLRFTEF